MLEAIYKRNRAPPRTGPLINLPPSGQAREMGVTGSIGPSRGSQQTLAIRNPTMEQRRQMMLCYKCGDPYSLGHQCRRQLLNMEGGEEKIIGKEQEDLEEMEEETPQYDPADEGGREMEDGKFCFMHLRGDTQGKSLRLREEWAREGQWC